MGIDRVKFRELVLYIADKSVDDQDFGATKLNKSLFFSDFLAYRLLAHSITGAAYQKLEHGPAPRLMVPLQRELVQEGAATIVPQSRNSFVQKRLVPLRTPDLRVFTAVEISLVDDVLSSLRGYSATKVSQLSHDLALGWQVAQIGDDIPYTTVFWRASDDKTLARGREVAAELGLLA